MLGARTTAISKSTLDAYSGSVISLLHMDGANGSTTFTDQKGKTWTRAGTAQISTAQSKFGGASARFTSAGDYISTSTVAGDSIATGDFTLELFARWNSFGSDKKYIVCADSVTSYWQFNHFNTTGPGFAANTNTIVSQGSNTGWSTGVWYHVAVVRFGNVFTIYRDGVSVASATSAVNIGHFGTLSIGGTILDAPTSSDAWFDEVRITKGVARYTGNFTPPILPFA